MAAAAGRRLNSSEIIGAGPLASPAELAHGQGQTLASQRANSHAGIEGPLAGQTANPGCGPADCCGYTGSKVAAHLAWLSESGSNWYPTYVIIIITNILTI
jgi:hypothetical protein